MPEETRLTRAKQKLSRTVQGFGHTVKTVHVKARQGLHTGRAYIYERGKTWMAEQPLGEAIRHHVQRAVTRLRATPWQAVALRHQTFFLSVGTVLLLSGIILAVWKAPQWQAASWEDQWKGKIEPKDLAKLESDARTTLVQALGGAALLIGLFFTWRSIRATERNLQITQETAAKNLAIALDGQITERFTRAIEQLGSKQLEVRLGAIYALERIARDSERDHWPIMKILTAYVRERAPIRAEPLPEEDAPSNETQAPSPTEPPPKPSVDIQAILTVLGRRARTYGQGENQSLDLRRTDLRNADFTDAHLERADLRQANLEAIDLTRVEHLAGVKSLCGAHLDPPLLEEIHQQYRHLLEEPKW